MWWLKLVHPKCNWTYAHLLAYNQNIKKKLFGTQARYQCWTNLIHIIISHGKNAFVPWCYYYIKKSKQRISWNR